ncbi:MAG: hypothetical protein IKH77_05310 [Clostridia bacterium]|nr:hypothetical protein [Clostridia bacterium]
MRLLKRRAGTTGIKSVSFGSRPDVHRLYVDAVAVTGGVRGLRCEKRLELIRVMTDAEVLTALCVERGAPQYLMPARRSPYRVLAGAFPLYARPEALASPGDNHAILTP